MEKKYLYTGCFRKFDIIWDVLAVSENLISFWKILSPDQVLLKWFQMFTVYVQISENSIFGIFIFLCIEISFTEKSV